MDRRKKSKVATYVLTLLSTFLVSVAILATRCSAQQTPPSLQIASPVAGTVFNPGQTITVSVTSPANASFSQVGIVAEDPRT